MAVSARAVWACALALIASPLAAGAEEPAPEVTTTAPSAEAQSAAQDVVPPVPLGSTAVPYPEGAPERTAPAMVKVLLTIGTTGEVTAVELLEGAGEPFDSAVLSAARQFRFQPATVNGEPTAVAVPFAQTFAPPVRADLAAAESLEAVLEGVVVERGTRQPVAHASVVGTDARGERATATDEQGRFVLSVAAGSVNVQVSANAYRRFVRVETLGKDERLRVKYLVDRESYNPYESIVISSRERTEMSRTSLSGREVHQVPGTFGDPFRVVSVLPGVTQVMSLLPMPIVRGSSPGDTGVFLDGVRLPLLFHLFGGPSVIHPELVERVDFYPGGFPASYGGYTGGIVDGQTRRAREGEQRLDLDLNLLQAGVFARHAVPGTNMVATVAGRYGYPGLVLSALNSTLSLGYWDYQARLDGGSARGSWSVFAYGARDEVQTVSPAGPAGPETTTTQALFLFHRLDLRWRQGDLDRNGTYRLVLGYDDSKLAGNQLSTKAWSLSPEASWTVPLRSGLRLRAGLGLLVRDVPKQAAAETTLRQTADAQAFLQQTGWLSTTGAFLELPYQPFERLLLVPGLRGDFYTQTGAKTWSVDPRFTARLRPSLVRDVWLKAMIGRFHQPPRSGLPIPGLDQASLELGLLASTQTGAGVEASLARGLELDVQGYYNHNNPVIFDFQTNPTLADVQVSGPTSLPGQLPSGTETEPTEVSRLLTKRVGRSYGLWDPLESTCRHASLSIL